MPVRLWVPEWQVLDALLCSGRLTEAEALQRPLVERALAAILTEWAARLRKKLRRPLALSLDQKGLLVQPARRISDGALVTHRHLVHGLGRAQQRRHSLALVGEVADQIILGVICLPTPGGPEQMAPAPTLTHDWH